MALLGGVALCASLSNAPYNEAAAQIPTTDVIGKVEWVKQSLTQASQLQQQVEGYALQLRQYANMVTNTVALPQQAWSTVASDIAQVRNLSNAASLLSGNSGTMLTRLNSAAGYAHVPDISTQLVQYQQTIGNNIDVLGRTLGLQQAQQRDNATLVQAIQQHGATATGQLQVLQAGVEMAGANASQLAQIQATLSATAQMMAENDVVAADRRALNDAALQGFLAAPAPPTTGYARW
ncbi:MAG: hypothetical protein M3Y41_06565 [Pseudomonadota bacterium]|nr:hypothetical protein [Pseudomonadota bacterium]